MARSHLRYSVKKGQPARLVAGAAVELRLGDSLLLDALYAGPEGDDELENPLISSEDQGEVECWIEYSEGIPGTITLAISDNDGAAHYCGSSAPQRFDEFTEDVEVYPAPGDVLTAAGDDQTAAEVSTDWDAFNRIGFEEDSEATVQSNITDADRLFDRIFNAAGDSFELAALLADLNVFTKAQEVKPDTTTANALRIGLKFNPTGKMMTLGVWNNAGSVFTEKAYIDKDGKWTWAAGQLAPYPITFGLVNPLLSLAYIASSSGIVEQGPILRLHTPSTAHSAIVALTTALANDDLASAEIRMFADASAADPKAIAIVQSDTNPSTWTSADLASGVLGPRLRIFCPLYPNSALPDWVAQAFYIRNDGEGLCWDEVGGVWQVPATEQDVQAHFSNPSPWTRFSVARSNGGADWDVLIENVETGDAVATCATISDLRDDSNPYYVIHGLGYGGDGTMEIKSARPLGNP